MLNSNFSERKNKMNKCSNCGAELPEGVKFCEKCETGDISSMLDLANKYREGKGVIKDVNRAFVLAYEAFAKGAKGRVFTTLGRFYLLGDFTAPDYKKANELFCRGANYGAPTAFYALGQSYLNGRGVEINLGAARFLFEKTIETAPAKKALQTGKNAQNAIKMIPSSIHSDSSGINGYTGKPDTSPLPNYVLADYEKAKAGALLQCKTCHNTGTVPCPNCGGKKEFECSNCHGKGHLDSCSDCGSTGKVACSTCGGTGKVGVDCPVCDHGKVKRTRLIQCWKCKGRGTNYWWDGDRETDEVREQHCSRCGGTGQVEDEYEDICPACHGDYKGYKGEKSCGSCGGTGKRTCSSCNGSGKKKCEKCGGRGKVECSQCHGAGSVKCPECQKREEEAAAAKAKREAAEKKRRAEAAAAEKRRKEKAAAAERERTRASYKSHGTFLTLGVLLGLLGVHFAYIGRWFLFLVQLALTGCGVVQLFVPSLNEHVQNWMMPFSMKLNELGWPWLGLAVQYPTLVLAGLWCLWGILFVTKDGTNHKMERSPNVNLVMYVLTFILQIWLFYRLADVKWPKTLTWGILETVGAMIILNLHLLVASQLSGGVYGVLALNILLAGIATGMNVFLPESIITLVLAITSVVIYLWTSFQVGKELER